MRNQKSRLGATLSWKDDLPKFAVRVDAYLCRYEVYELATGVAWKAYLYRKASEQGAALRQAEATRDEMNGIISRL